MVEEISIRNFKSIVNLKLPLGRFNVLIGPNGCGKSNILEAIAFASAAAGDKLSNEYLLNRDIRISDPAFMVNAFAEEDEEEEDEEISDGGERRFSLKKTVTIEALTGGRNFICQLHHEPMVNRWINLTDSFNTTLQALLTEESDRGKSTFDLIQELQQQLYNAKIDKDSFLRKIEELRNPAPELAEFLTYRPTEQQLRKYFETPILPLGVHGEGLLKYLKDAAQQDDKVLFKEINEGLELLDWFDGFSIPDELMTNEYRLMIGDRYLKESLHYFDQRSTNEGFLFLLFYLTLFNSRQTPKFFAIDNLETALNPRLATKLTEYLATRCFENDKQVILTTHSPFVLDGLDLSNPDVRLFVCRRDIDGHTRIERLEYKADRKMKLSQLWMSGLIGGLPDNF